MNSTFHFSPWGLLFSRMNTSRTRKVAVFPGQFDPITNGHLDVIQRAVPLFDDLIVAVGNNPEKREMFTIDEHMRMVRSLLKETPGRAWRSTQD